jgi:ketosteroid isomerase-like protein
MNSPDPDEAAIRAARAHSNRSIARRNLLGVGDSLAPDFVGVIGDGTFVPSRAEYLRLFKLGFDKPKEALTYERIPDRIDFSNAEPLAAEHGHWIARRPDGQQAYTGTYMAVWKHTLEGWKIRSEMFVSLTCS